MRDQLEEWRVGECITRLILLRVQPGRELAVGREIERRCSQAIRPPQTIRVFRLFGSYDLLVINDQARLGETNFVNIGSLPFVTGSNEYVCSNWVTAGKRKPAATFTIDAAKGPLLAVCFLKINPAITRRLGLIPELSFASYAQRHYPSIQMLSTLGWAETVLLISEPSLTKILKFIGTDLPGLLLEYRAKELPTAVSFLEKTLTIVGHSLDVSDQLLGKDRRVIVPIGGEVDLKITLSLSCVPQATATLERSAKEYFGVNLVYSRLGTRDLDFDVPVSEIETFNDLLERLDAFRRQNSEFLIRTYTRLKYCKQRPALETNAVASSKPLSVRLTPEEATSLSKAGPEGTSVATAIYQFNNLLQTSVSADAYVDLMRFMIALKNQSLRHASHKERDASDPITVSRREIAQKLSHLDLALAQRSQSVYAGLEESPFGVFPAGVGLQRVTKGLEAYASTILSRYGRDWNGFVRFGHLSSRMEHFIDVLVVPMDVSIAAQRHWMISHEVMHVLQTTDVGVLSIRGLRRRDQFGNEMQYPEIQAGSPQWLTLMESMVDVLDYALTCPLPLDQYLATIWTFLNNEIFPQQAASQWSIYLLRSFAVITFDHFGLQAESEVHLFQRAPLRSFLESYVQKLSGWANLEPLKEVDGRGETRLTLILEQFLNEYVFYLPSMFAKVRSIAKKRDCDMKAISNAIRRLESGRILSDAQMQNVDHIAWLIGYQKKIDGRLGQAWLLSLWHHYQRGTNGLELGITKPSPIKANQFY